LRLPKIRELGEAIGAIFGRRYTTRFPACPVDVPERYRGKPEFDTDKCIGCGACVNACPTEALTLVEDLNARPPFRRLTLRWDRCIFCGNCSENCTTSEGIKLSRQWDLAGLDRSVMSEEHTFGLVLCQRCGAVVGTKKHIIWLCRRLGPLAYSNPTLLLASGADVLGGLARGPVRQDQQVEIGDFVQVLCPRCRYQLNISF
jgi:formate hydrogenlyase subunit 6/NADH:ubiquinone oxidoreductase subunit I